MTPTPDTEVNSEFNAAWQSKYLPAVMQNMPGGLIGSIARSHIPDIRDKGANPLWDDAWRACEAWHAANDPK